MVPVAFDSNEYARSLMASGVPEPQTQAFVALKLEIHGLSVRIDELRLEMERRFLLQEERFDRKLAALKAELIQWMFGFFVAQMAANFAMIKLMAS